MKNDIWLRWLIVSHALRTDRMNFPSHKRSALKASSSSLAIHPFDVHYIQRRSRFYTVVFTSTKPASAFSLAVQIDNYYRYH